MSQNPRLTSSRSFAIMPTVMNAVADLVIAASAAKKGKKAVQDAERYAG